MSLRCKYHASILCSVLLSVFFWRRRVMLFFLNWKCEVTIVLQQIKIHRLAVVFYYNLNILYNKLYHECCINCLIIRWLPRSTRINVSVLYKMFLKCIKTSLACLCIKAFAFLLISLFILNTYLLITKKV